MGVCSEGSLKGLTGTLREIRIWRNLNILDNSIISVQFPVCVHQMLHRRMSLFLGDASE